MLAARTLARPGHPGRRRSALAALSVSLLLALAAPAGAGAAPKTTVLEPRPANAYWFGVAWQVPFDLRGAAKPRARVTASAACAIGTCTATTTADKSGRWTLGFDPVVKAHSRSFTLTVLADGKRLVRTYTLTAPAGTAPSSRGVIVIGDSLAKGTAGLLPAYLPGRHVTTHSRSGRTLAAGLRAFAHTPIDRRIQVAVFSLFTNDDPAAVASLRSAVQRTMARLGSRRCAVWYTVRRPAVGGRSYRDANDALHALAADPRYGGRLFVVPWWEAVDRRRKLLTADRVHPTAAGARVRAQLTAEAVDRCAVAPR